MKIRKLADELLNVENSDTIYRSKSEAVVDPARQFAFGPEVADVFDDMVSRSVPQYLDAQLLSIIVCRNFAGAGSRIYDLGCSTATTIASLIRELRDRPLEIVGVDASESMLAKARLKLGELGVLEEEHPCRVRLLCEQLQDIDFEPASVVLMNYTLQFLDPSERIEVLRRIQQCLEPEGVLVLSEKTKTSAPLVTQLHEDFKRMNGYSDLEIARKRESLKGVMTGLSEEENLAMLKKAGFGEPTKLLQAYEFVSWVVPAAER